MTTARADPLSRHALYELCTQNAPMTARLLHAIHGSSPQVLAEDFCGTAAVSRAWVAAAANRSAVAIDIDPEICALARGHPRVRVIEGDVRRVSVPARLRADVMFVGNFSIGEIHSRSALVRYLKHARSRLKSGGVFVCDTYGGATAFTVGTLERERTLDDRRRVKYTWQQRSADPLTGMVENAIHFRVLRGRDVELELTDAFVYRWRLWSVPELREALAAAGFSRTDVFGQVPDALDHTGAPYVRPITDPADLGESWAVCVAGRISARSADRP